MHSRTKNFVVGILMINNREVKKINAFMTYFDYSLRWTVENTSILYFLFENRKNDL